VSAQCVRTALLWAVSLALFAAGAAPARAVQDSPAAAHYELGLRALANGDFEQAIQSGVRAARLYMQRGETGRQAEALHLAALGYQALGRYEKALDQLNKGLTLSRSIPDRRRIVKIAADMASTYRRLGAIGQAEASIREALALARDLNDPGLLAAVLCSLSYLYEQQERYSEAAAACREGIPLAADPVLRAELTVNLASALMSGDSSAAEAALATAYRAYVSIKDSHDKAYGLTRIGRGYLRIAKQNPQAAVTAVLSARESFSAAAETAGQIGDRRALSYALGYLGQLCEQTGQSEEALGLTRRAIFTAQQIGAQELLYMWEWQLGRLFAAQGKLDEAVSAYRSSVENLQVIRQQVAAGCRSCGQPAFRESARPVFFEYADLLLRRPADSGREREQQRLREVREVIERLKAAELQDYFQDPCVVELRSKKTSLEDVAKDTVIVYTIGFEKRLDLLVSFKSGMKRFSVPVDSRTLTQEIRAMRTKLEKRTTWGFLPHAQKLYDWLVRPMEEDLRAQKVGALVFVPDGALRTIPMAALHDGEQFLIERFPVVTTPGLDLTDPHPISRKGLKVLSGGLTESVQGYPPLPNVKTELEKIHDIYSADCLEDREFVAPRVGEKLKETPYSIVHVATHGEFAGKASETFLLTWDGKIGMDQLDQLIKQCQFRKDPVELLTLSACQTAAGDDTAALGLAGVAVKAGARSALATLWNVSDEAASELVVEFYRQMHDSSVSKAGALRLAQLKMLDMPGRRHPFYWSPFLLIGNWL
jgi:CHAT domain-containing protein